MFDDFLLFLVLQKNSWCSRVGQFKMFHWCKRTWLSLLPQGKIYHLKSKQMKISIKAIFIDSKLGLYKFRFCLDPVSFYKNWFLAIDS
jgi:hypothetical protein